MSKSTPQFWLLKSEPESYSIDAFARDGKTLWTGVRNYQARNFMVGEEINTQLGKPGPSMRVGDLFLFYHSSAEPPACVGVGCIEKVNQVDPTQFDKKSEAFEPKASKAKPMWFCCEVAYVKHFVRPVPLAEIRAAAKLAKMVLLQKGSRLSIQPVTKQEFDEIGKLSGE